MSLIKIQYLLDSGFAIDYDEHFLVVDYTGGPLALPSDKEILFLVTQNDRVHYSPSIFTLPGTKNAHYVLFDDVEKVEKKGKIFQLSDTIQKTERMKVAYDPHFTRRTASGKHFDFAGISFTSFPSNHGGMAILFEMNEVSFFHAGSLNAQLWPEMDENARQKETEAFLSILHQVKNNPIDVSFGIVDPSLGENAFIGPIFFIKTLAPQIFIPMHFDGLPSVTETFKEAMQPKTKTIIQTISGSGDQIFVRG